MIIVAAALSVAMGASLDVVEKCLALNDVPCARAAIEAIPSGARGSPDVLAAEAEVHFYAGDYPRAVDTLTRAVDAGWVDRFDDLPLYTRALHATAGWVERGDDHFAVRYRPGVDAVLVPDALHTLALAERNLAPLIGEPAPGRVLVEIFPDSTSFTASSSLMLEDVRTTGVIALSKWSRLLITSPRARGRGYDWQNTMAHEYIHLVVSHNSHERAPVWLQEAIAKYLDNRWETGEDGFRLDPRAETFLAEGLRRDQLVTFEEMSPSLAKLETAERAALAYAQLSTLMAYCFEVGGDRVVQRTLERVAVGEDAQDALASAAGATSFDALERGWRTWVEGLHLKEASVEELPVVLDGGDNLDLDPVLSRQQDLGRFVLLGNLSAEHGEHAAALVEYDKAVDPEEPGSPVLANRMAAAMLELGRAADAQRVIEASLVSYPDFPLSHKTLGGVHLLAGRAREARDSLRAAAALNPFDGELQAQLAALARGAGDEREATYRDGLVRILRRGGEDETPPPIHDRSGDFTPPSYPEAPAAKGDPAESWRGELAPPFEAVDMDGRAVSVSPGKVTVLDFWATWCGPCVSAIPELGRLQAAHAGAGVQVVGVTDERADVVRKFQAKHDMPYRVALDRAGRTRARYEVVSLPTVFIIGRDGRVVDVVRGAGEGPAARIEAAVLEALGEG